MIERSISIGTELSGAAKRYAAARLLTFSGGPIAEPGFPRKNIHTDTQFARSTGLPARCASGTHFQGQMVEFLIDLFGESWFNTGTMNVKFVDLVLEDQTVTAHARVTNRIDDPKSRARIELDIWSMRGDGRQVMTGTAIGLVD